MSMQRRCSPPSAIAWPIGFLLLEEFVLEPLPLSEDLVLAVLHHCLRGLPDSAAPLLLRHELLRCEAAQGGSGRVVPHVAEVPRRRRGPEKGGLDGVEAGNPNVGKE